MDNNKFKQSQDFNNVESNLEKNPANHSESLNQQKNDNANDLKNNEQNVNKEGIPNIAKEQSLEAWKDQAKTYNDAWENNKNDQLGTG